MLTHPFGPPADNVQLPASVWSNIDTPAPAVMRRRGRVFVGNAALMHDQRSSTNSTWLGTNAGGASWGPRDSQMAVMHDRGGIALMGASRASDGNDVATLAPVGVAGFIINDTNVETRAAWALYSDVQHEPVATNAASYGLEIAAKNKGANIAGHSYGVGYGVHGVWAQGGGDGSYGGSPVNPSNSVLTVVKGSSTWNVGIVFAADAITGTDGVTGTGTVIEMAKGHTIRWRMAGGIAAGKIRADAAISGRGVGIILDSNLVYLQSEDGLIFNRFTHVLSGVNSFTFTDAIAGSPPVVSAVGSDTNIDFSIVSKGTGVVKFGTHSAIAAETLSGYITIKDAGGTTRKVAVIS